MKTESYTLKPVKHKTTKALLGAYPYKYINSYLEKNFKYEKPTAKNVVLKNYPGRLIYSKEVLEELKKEGLRPLSAIETLIFAIQHPEAWKDKWVAGLGTQEEIDGYNRVVYLDGDGVSRGACLTFWDRDWNDGWFFAASPLESSESGTLSPGKSEQTLDIVK